MPEMASDLLPSVYRERYAHPMSQTEGVQFPLIYGAQCDTAIQAADLRAISKLCDELRAKDTSEDSVKSRSFLNYCLGNLCSAWSRIDGETANGWRSNTFPIKRSNAIDHFRKALKLDEEASFSWHSEAQTNLGNELAYQGRGIEAMAYWKARLSEQRDAGFVSALSRTRELVWTSHWLNDESHCILFQYEAYRQAKELERHEKETDHPFVLSALGPGGELRALIEHGDENFSSLQNWQDECQPSTHSEGEMSYRQWCLKHRLFANPLILLTDRWIAAKDVLQFPNHVVKVGEGPFLSAAFSSIKREYCFARLLAYEGANGIHPSWENDELFLTDTLDSVHLDGATEKLKTSLRVCFGVFDSLAFLLNRYFQRGAAVSEFRPRWIKENLGHIDNPFLSSLYWLACDLSDTSKIPAGIWKAPQAELSEIRKLRNAVEHGWLRIAVGTPGIWHSDSDFAETITPSELKRLVLLTLRVTRSALVYLTQAVKFHENHQPKDPSLVIPIPAPLLDSPGAISAIFGFGDDKSE